MVEPTVWSFDPIAHKFERAHWNAWFAQRVADHVKALDGAAATGPAASPSALGE